MQYIVKAEGLPGNAAIDSNRKLFSASKAQLHKTDIFNRTYG